MRRWESTGTRRGTTGAGLSPMEQAGARARHAALGAVLPPAAPGSRQLGAGVSWRRAVYFCLWRVCFKDEVGAEEQALHPREHRWVAGAQWSGPSPPWHGKAAAR